MKRRGTPGELDLTAQGQKVGRSKKERRTPGPLDLTPEEQRAVDQGLEQIREVLKRRDINIANVIGLVTTDEVEETAKQVDIRFAEEIRAVVMNMVAFD